MRKTSGPVDRRLLRFARPAAGALAALAGLALAQAAATVTVAVAAAGVVVALLDGSGWIGAAAALGAGLAVRALARAFQPLTAHRVSSRVIEEARQHGLEAIARRGAGRASAPATAADPAALLSTGLEPLRPWFAEYLPALVVAAVLPVSVVVLMALLDLASGLTVLLTLPLVPLFAALIGWATQRQAAARYDEGGRLAGHFLDVVRGLVTLKLFGRAERQIEEVRAASRRYARATTRVLSVAFLSSAALDLVATISVGLVAVGAGVRLAGGEMALWPALAVIVLAPEAYRPLREAGARFHDSAQASAVMDALEELAPGGGGGPASAPAPAPTPVRGRISGPRREAGTLRAGVLPHTAADGAGRAAATELPVVELRGAVVRYPGRREAVRLPELAVHPGELVAVAGPSGSGKSTLLRVLAGAQRPDEGQARARAAELVTQRPALPLARTVREALLGDVDGGSRQGPAAPDRTGTRPGDEMLRALLRELLLDLGLDTPLGDGGTGVSTGQRQRLALARAVLRARLTLDVPRAQDEPPGTAAAPVLLVDEPTAHLDTAAERAVVAVLHGLADAGAAVVVTAHRRGLLAAADRVVPLPGSGAEPVAAPAHDPVARRGRPPESRPAGPGRPLLAGLRRRWAALSPGRRLALAGVAGALSMLSGLGLTVAASWLIVRASVQPPILTLSIAVVFVRGFGIARPLLRYLERLAAHDAALTQLAEWRARVVATLIPQVPGRLTARRGVLLTRVVEDVDTRLDGLVRGAVPGGAALAALGVVAIALVCWHPPALLPLGVVVLVTAVVAGVLARQDRRITGGRDAARTDLHDAVVSALESPEELASGRGLAAAVRARALPAARAESRRARVDGLAAGGGEATGALLVLGAVLVAVEAAGTVPREMIGILVLGALAATEVTAALLPALRARAAGRAARDRLAALAPPPTGAPARHRSFRSPALPTGLPGRRLELRDLAVGWADRTVREGVELSLAAGEVAEIGWPSGAGKSTLAATLAGLIPPVAGSVLLDGGALGPADLRQRVALAGDPDHIFATTVRENLRVARPGATDADLLAAVEAAYLGGWLRGLSRGLDTWLGSGGHTLSGGERRRLILARALLREAELLILDEPTSGLDQRTADALLTDLRARARERGQALLLLRHQESRRSGPSRSRNRARTGASS